MSACKACMAALVWIKTPAGKSIPCNEPPLSTTSRSRASAVRKLSLGTGKCFRANTRKTQLKQPVWAMCRIGQPAPVPDSSGGNHMDKLTWYDEDGRLYCRRGYEVALARLASYEATGLTPEQCENAKTIIESAFANDTSKAERIRELLKADKNGRLVVLPFSDSDDVEIKRGGITYKSDHWNIHLTAFAENQPTPSGKKVGLFSVEEAAAAMEVNDV